MRFIPARLAGPVVLLALLTSAAPALADVPPGFDLFETDPAATVFSFREEFTIPPNFFDQGSAPFEGDVTFGGVPIGTFQGNDVGDADTIVHRSNPAVLAPPFPAQSIIPIDLVSLSLISIQPIQVQVGSGTQAWDVRAGLSPTRESQGVLRILQTSPEGGAFDSALRVFPKFTFTRLSDGATREIDVGQLPSNPQSLNDLTLTANNQPWRAGCVPPALAIPGLNDGFCRGQTEGGLKQLVPQQSRLVKHGVYPAQPHLEHLKCYESAPLRRFKPRRVSLVDQFGDSRTRVLSPGSLCTPVRKNAERFSNRRAHLHCYPTRRSPAFTPRNVAVRNQFGSAVLRLSRPTALCAPAVKTRPSRRTAPQLGPDERIDHFTCYRTSAPRGLPRPRVRLAGQFGRERVRVLRPTLLCAPVSKNGEGVEHPVRHLVCYRIRDLGGRRFRQRLVRVHDQFGSRVVVVQLPAALCVPSLKVPL
jgi:hypothetical protein